jgi:hypothetical protein
MFIELEWQRTLVDLPLRVTACRFSLHIKPFCSENKHAKVDVCIVDRSQNDILLVLLLVQEEKSLEHEEPVNAQAHVDPFPSLRDNYS